MQEEIFRVDSFLADAAGVVDRGLDIFNKVRSTIMPQTTVPTSDPAGETGGQPPVPMGAPVLGNKSGPLPLVGLAVAAYLIFGRS
jgi:hypothetical protein